MRTSIMNRFGLSRDAIKIIALISMTIDHAGLILFDNLTAFRIIGRLAFPLFAYMIAEGCHYTRNKKRYLGTVFLFGLLCQVFYSLALRSLYQNVLITFSMSILTIYAVTNAFIRRSKKSIFFAVLSIFLDGFICYILPRLLPGLGFHVDYGFWGVMLPVLIALARSRYEKLIALTLGMLLICLSSSSIQLWSLFALIPMAFYTGEPGKYKLKHLFYLYYPAHLVILYGIGYVLHL